MTGLIEDVMENKTKRQPVGKSELQRRASSIDGIGSSREEMLTKMISQISIATIEERVGMCVLNPTANGMCPDVRPRSVREFLVKCWG